MFGNNWIAKECPLPGQLPPGSRKINFALSTLWAGLGWAGLGGAHMSVLRQTLSQWLFVDLDLDRQTNCSLLTFYPFTFQIIK